MALSKTTRISIMLAISTVFFWVELIAGFVVHSLALTADAFHMLNDIISLIVGLWAVRISKRQSTDKYSYGWVRAEILGGFFNAVFLIALCVSIIIESISRFVEPPEIDNPKLILIVGCFGLASNLAGFVILGHGGHDHGHSHDHGEGGDGHSHGHQAHDAIDAEEGRAGLGDDSFADDDGPATDIYPEVAVARANAAVTSPDTVKRIQFGGTEGHLASDHVQRSTSRPSASRDRERRRANSHKHSRLHSIDDHSFHPSSFRHNIIQQSRSNVDDADDSSTGDESVADETTPLVGTGSNVAHNGTVPAKGDHKGRGASQGGRRDSSIHTDHRHNRPKSSKKSSSHGHNHDDMGMRAMVLHVLGDALGNVGVIITALIIWLTDWPGKLYADPAVSLVITAIILRTALPLTSATAKVLLQATPDEIEIEDIKQDIQTLEGVISCHHVHVWRLSDTRIVASLHIQVAFHTTEKGGKKYMALAKQVRKCLHAYGIHSATIQPEFCLDEDCSHEQAAAQLDGQTILGCGNSDRSQCLLGCTDDCMEAGCCTAPASVNGGGSIRSNHSTHSH